MANDCWNKAIIQGDEAKLKKIEAPKLNKIELPTLKKL